MSRTSTLGPASLPALRRNHLLASLGPETQAEVVARASHVDMSLQAPLYEPGEPINHVDFGLCGLISIVATSRQGRRVPASDRARPLRHLGP